MKNKLFKTASSFVAVLFVLSFLVVFNGSAAAAGSESDHGNPQFNEEYIVQGEIILKFKSNVPQSVIDKLNDKHGITKLQTNSRGVIKAKVPKGKSVEEMVTILSENPNVEYAQPNYICYAVYDPNDPYYRYQWNLDNGTGGINAEDAWDLTDGSGAIVAILDTGIAYENYGIYLRAGDLAQTSFIPGYDFINNDAHANDDNAHGTHVAGTVAQSTNNGIGVAGVAYGTTLMPVKVLNAGGSGTSYSLADGLYYATDHGANIINMSLAWPVYQLSGTWVAFNPGAVVSNAIEYAYNHGVTLVAAAGNDGASVVAYPAAYDQCIAVGATNSAESLASFTNRGSALDLTAPGQSILQQTFNPNTKVVSDFGYWYFSGTSMASPHVAGVAALLFSSGVTDPAEIKRILYETAEDHGAMGWDSQYGWGIVDAYAAVSSVGASPNNPPIATDDAYITSEDNILNVTEPGVLANDTDTDGDLLTATIVNSPSNGTLSLNADGSFLYTPDNDFNGSDSFTYKANDGKADSNTGTVSITINPVNDSPVAVNDSYTTSEDNTLDIAAPGVLANDTDPDGDLLTAAIVSSPSNGTLSLNADGSFLYTPDNDFNGSDSFTYKANDGITDSNITEVTITINAVNQLPLAVDDSYTTDEDNALDAAAPGVLANDTDPDGDLLTATIVSSPSNGTLSLNADGSFLYTPDNDFNGSDSFTYKANDGIADSNVATVTITVNSINDAPVADPGGPYAGTVGDPVIFDGSGSMDPDGDAISYSWLFGDGKTGKGVNPSNTYDTPGSYTVNLTVTDTNGLTDMDTATVIISAPITVITITGITPSTISAGESISITITGSGFVTGTDVNFKDGAGPAPAVSNVVLIDSNTITATVSTKSGGPPKNRTWDVQLTNPDGSSALLYGGLIVTNTK